jgi:uncharacterized protein (UPF0548 family)
VRERPDLGSLTKADLTYPEVGGTRGDVVELQDDDVVTLTITAFSRPASLLARAAGPVGRTIQGWATTRYLRSVAT